MSHRLGLVSKRTRSSSLSENDRTVLKKHRASLSKIRPAIIPKKKITAGHVMAVVSRQALRKSGHTADAMSGSDEESREVNDHFLDIRPVSVPAMEIPVPEAMAKIGLRHPWSLTLYGGSRSGKSTVLYNILRNPRMYAGYFDEEWLMAPTATLDDTLKSLKIKKERIISKNFAKGLEKYLKMCHDDVEKNGLLKAKKRHLWIDDATSLRRLMHSEAYSQSGTSGRHDGTSISYVVHKYKAQEHTARMNQVHHMIFPLVAAEVTKVADELQPASMGRDEFEAMCHWAWTPEERVERPFLWVNQMAPVETRFRKTLRIPYTPDASTPDIDDEKSSDDLPEPSAQSQ